MRIVLIVSMFFISVLSYSLESPQNIKISCPDSVVTLQWDNVKGSEKYYIKVSTLPDAEKILHDSTSANIYSEPVNSGTKMNFYQITAKNSLPEELVYVQGGTYLMGDHYSEGAVNELPVHSVTVSNFYLSGCEVKQSEWMQIMGTNPATVSSGLGDVYPVYNVSLYEILVYCNKRSISEGITPCYSINGTTDPDLWGNIPAENDTSWNSAICDWSANGYRLPSEAEWEYAARGGIYNTNDYRFSGCQYEAELSDYAWCFTQGILSSQPVGIKLSNQLGLHDMSGNNLEWCWDIYDDYSGENQYFPTGPEDGTLRVCRGGCWDSPDILSYCVANRKFSEPHYKGLSLGFRVARTPRGSTVDFPTPEDLSVSQIDLRTAGLTWKDNNFSEDKFEIERKLSGDTVYIKVGEVSGSDTAAKSWSDSTLVINTFYDYRVRAVKGFNNTDYAVTENYYNEFKSPSNLTVTQYNLFKAIVSWSDNSLGEEKFEIERKLSADSTYVKIAEIIGNDNPAGSWIDTTLVLGQVYDYRVMASCDTLTTDYAVKTGYEAQFKAPTDLTVAESNIFNAVLVWKDNSLGEEKFEIERKLSADSTYVKIAEIIGNDSLAGSWIDTTLIMNMTYDFRVRAVYNTIATEYAVKTGYTAEFRAPTNLKAGKTVITTSRLEWTINSSGQEGFAIDRKTGDDDWVISYAIVGSSQNYWVETSLNSQKYFSYRVRAFNKLNFSGYSNAVSVSSDFIRVERGTFIMGDHHNEGYLDEKPVHQVTQNSFYIQNTEVTQKNWFEVMGYNPCYVTYGLGDNYPVYGISWYDIIVYCNKKSIIDGITPCYSISGSKNPADWGSVPLTQNVIWDAVVCDWKADGYRLLTEAEWEYAARGGSHSSDNFRFSGCHEDIDLSKYCLYESSKFIPVKSKLPNQLGLYDMSGNVCEFCWDWYSYYTDEKQINPVGYKSIAQRIRRGGARYSTPKGQRVANRASYNPSTRFTGGEIGFRIGASTLTDNFYAVTVTYPDSLCAVLKGTVMPIKWSDNFDENVRIDLYKNGVYFSTISNSVTSTGTFNWTIPSGIVLSQDYKIKISSVNDPEISDLSDTDFIVTDTITPEIEINFPADNSNIMKNRINTIRWSDNFPENVKIDLYKVKLTNTVPPSESLQFYRTISESEFSDGIYEWIPDKTVKTDNLYRLIISSVANASISCTSGKFSVKELESQRMIFVEGGTFSMGDVLNEGNINEKPLRQVSLNSFYMSNYEVTQSEWISIMGSNPSKPETGIGQYYPVSNVLWYAALVYCNKRSLMENLTPCYSISGTTDPALWGAIPTYQNSTWDKAVCNWSANGYRLPTEAEWEYAARGGIHFTENLRFTSCTDECEICLSAWLCGNCSGSTREVGALIPNSLGIYDMNGNIWEWCWDFYGYYQASALLNPTGPTYGAYKVQRGGSLVNFPESCRVSYRDFISISGSGYMVYSGFRVVRSN